VVRQFNRHSGGTHILDEHDIDQPARTRRPGDQCPVAQSNPAGIDRGGERIRGRLAGLVEYQADRAAGLRLARGVAFELPAWKSVGEILVEQCDRSRRVADRQHRGTRDGQGLIAPTWLDDDGRGVELSRACQARLEDAERRIEVLSERGDVRPAPLTLTTDADAR